MFSVLLAIEIPLGPNLFEIGGLEITWHGLFAALAVVAGVGVAVIFGRRAGYTEETIYNIALALVGGGIIGARGLFVIENWGQFKDDPSDIFALNAGGISLYGSLIGGTIGALLYGFLGKVPNKWRGADVAVLGAILGMAVGRIGDIINGEHFAKTTSLPWGMKYTDMDSPGFTHPAGPAAVTHPAVAYELLGDLAIFLALLAVYRKSERPGLTFLAWAFLYAAMRLGLSFLRLDDIVWAGLGTAQIIAIVVMALVVPTAIYLLRSELPKGPTRAERRRLTRAERRRLAREEAGGGSGGRGGPPPDS